MSIAHSRIVEYVLISLIEVILKLLLPKFPLILKSLLLLLLPLGLLDLLLNRFLGGTHQQDLAAFLGEETLFCLLEGGLLFDALGHVVDCYHHRVVFWCQHSLLPLIMIELRVPLRAGRVSVQSRIFL